MLLDEKPRYLHIALVHKAVLFKHSGRSFHANHDELDALLWFPHVVQWSSLTCWRLYGDGWPYETSVLLLSPHFAPTRLEVSDLPAPASVPELPSAWYAWNRTEVKKFTKAHLLNPALPHTGTARIARSTGRTAREHSSGLGTGLESGTCPQHGSGATHLQIVGEGQPEDVCLWYPGF